MRVIISIETSEGEEVKVFSEYIRTEKQLEALKEVLEQSLSLEIALQTYIGSMGEQETP